MKYSARYALLAVLAGFVVFSGDALFAAPVLVDNSPLHPPGVYSRTIPEQPGVNGNPAIRDLRTDFIRTWHIFADTVNDGVLGPGDTRIGKFQNWWTPESAATQHGYEINAPPLPAAAPPTGFDYTSNPIDHQSNYTTNTTQYLPQETGTIGFYMTYSVRDNADYTKEFYDAGTGDPEAFQQRNYERNGYAMGWLTGATNKDATGTLEYDTKTADVKMDIFIHNGKSRNDPDGVSGIDDQHNFGANNSTAAATVYYPGQPNINVGDTYSTVSRSEPQAVQSNDMDLLARQANNLMLVPDYRDEFKIDAADPKGYTYGASDGYDFAYNDGKYRVGDSVFPTAAAMHDATAGEFATVVNSMDVREVNSFATTLGGTDDLGGFTPINGDHTPQKILSGPTAVSDGLGNPYFYEDAFVQRDGATDNGSPWLEGSTDGGVIAGLSGFDEYSQYYPGGDNPDPTKLLTHWGEQQVIRIDFDKETFDLGTSGEDGIRKIAFYDWGAIDSNGQQLSANIVEIVINIDAATKDIYFEKDGVAGMTAGDILFPDNIIYIAQVEHTPEPATMIMLTVGASGLLARRRRRRK